MSNALLALELLSLTIGLAAEFAEATPKLVAAIRAARAENRDITPEELADIRAENEALKDRVLAKLDAAGRVG